MSITYNHAYTIGFSTLSKHSDSDDDPVTKEELFAGIMRRMSDLLLNDDEILEACGKPFDTYIEED